MVKKIAVVTGSAQGLGRAIAIDLAKRGYIVVITFRKSKKEAEATLVLIVKKSPQSIIFQADLTNENDAQALFEKVEKMYGRIDLLVNNVGNFIYKDFDKTTNTEFKDIFQTNVYASLICSREALKLMRKQKNGHIVNIGSVGAEKMVLRIKSAAYFIAKNALYNLTKTMAWEEARNGIHINMVSPASLVTDIFKPSDFPMGRSAKYEDVIKVVHFLTSEDAYYINGANIEVAGGFIPGID